MLSRLNMSDCKSRSTPSDVNLNKITENDNSEYTDGHQYRSIIGSLIYTRPDLSFMVSYLSQFMSKPKSIHMTMAKHVLRYLKGTKDYGLIFRKSSADLNLIGYCDADWANSMDRRSVTGYVFMVG